MIECTTFYEKKKLVKPEDLIFRPSVYGFITHENKLLVVNLKSTGKLGLPGGGIEKGELISHALIREVKEETNLEVVVGDLIGVTESFFYYDPWNEAWHGLLLFYHCEATSFDLLDVESINNTETGTEKPAWVDIAKLQAEDFIPAFREIYAKWASERK